MMLPDYITISVTALHIANGTREDATCCPIALALIDQGWQGVCVLPTTAGIEAPDGQAIDYWLGQSALDFVVRFDHGLPVQPTAFRMVRARREVHDATVSGLIGRSPPAPMPHPHAPRPPPSYGSRPWCDGTGEVDRSAAAW